MTRHPPRSPLFPSPPLSRSQPRRERASKRIVRRVRDPVECRFERQRLAEHGGDPDECAAGTRVPPFSFERVSELRVRANARERQRGIACGGLQDLQVVRRDRKSTRLNSSHLVISYAVFCLKKK